MQHSLAARSAHTKWKVHHGPEDVEEVDCPLCGGSDRTLVAREWGLGIARCRGCSLVYVSPRLRDAEKNYWMDAEAKREKYGAILRGEAEHPRDPNYREHLAVLSQVKPEGRLLDIGPYLGFFLRLARGMKWKLHGIEPSETSAALGAQAFGLDIRTGFLQDAGYPSTSFDVVTLMDVFEHVTKPRELLAEAHRILSSSGVIFIKVPNADYNLLKFRVLRQFLRLSAFDIFDSREHVVHYSVRTLRRLLEEVGFERVMFYIPRPIQSGAWWKRAARTALYAIARAWFELTGHISPAVSDLAVVAWKR